MNAFYKNTHAHAKGGTDQSEAAMQAATQPEPRHSCASQLIQRVASRAKTLQPALALFLIALLTGCTSLREEYQGWPLKPYPIEQQRKEYAPQFDLFELPSTITPDASTPSVPAGARPNDAPPAIPFSTEVHLAPMPAGPLDAVRAQIYIAEAMMRLHPHHTPRWFVRDAWLPNAVAEPGCRTNEFLPGTRVDVWWVNERDDDCQRYACPGATPPRPPGWPADDYAMVPARTEYFTRTTGIGQERIRPPGALFTTARGYWPAKTTVVIPGLDDLRRIYP